MLPFGSGLSSRQFAEHIILIFLSKRILTYVFLSVYRCITICLHMYFFLFAKLRYLRHIAIKESVQTLQFERFLDLRQTPYQGAPFRLFLIGSLRNRPMEGYQGNIENQRTISRCGRRGGGVVGGAIA